MLEVWKPITIQNGIYKDWYEISSFGNVRSYKNHARGRLETPKILNLETIKSPKNTREYKRVSLYYELKVQRYSIYSLVAHEFISPRPKGLVINHKDNNGFNNTLDNLEYCTQKANLHHAKLLGRYVGKYNPKTKLNEESVKEIRKLYETGGYSSRRLAKMFNVQSKSTILRIINGQTWNHI